MVYECKYKDENLHFQDTNKNVLRLYLDMNTLHHTDFISFQKYEKKYLMNKKNVEKNGEKDNKNHSKI